MLSFLYGLTLTSIHNYWKNHSFDYTDIPKVMSLLYNMLSRLVIAFLPRSKPLLDLSAAQQYPELHLLFLRLITMYHAFKTVTLQMVTAAMKLKDA